MPTISTFLHPIIFEGFYNNLTSFIIGAPPPPILLSITALTLCSPLVINDWQKKHIYDTINQVNVPYTSYLPLCTTRSSFKFLLEYSLKRIYLLLLWHIIFSSISPIQHSTRKPNMIIVYDNMITYWCWWLLFDSVSTWHWL